MAHENPLRTLARLVKRTPDRLLHAGRRRRARARLARAHVDSVLFVCHGNICRSPFAEHAARGRLGDVIRVTSAGFIGPGRTSPSEAVTAARAFGVDLTAHRSTMLTAAAARAAGLVVVMTASQARAVRRLGVPATQVLVLGDLDPKPIDLRAIPDPIEQPPAVFDACFRRADRCVAELTALLTRSVPA